MRPERYYKQEITYWAPLSSDGFGAPAWAPPVLFFGRWEDKTETVIGSRGEVIDVKTMVWFPQTLIILQNGYLFLGVSALTEPRQVVGASKVVTLGVVPDLRNLNTMKVAML